MNRQGLIKLLQSNLSDEDVLDILKDIVCTPDTNAYRQDYQPWFTPGLRSYPHSHSQFGDH